MEKGYLNKLLKDTAKVVKVVSAQKESFDKALPVLENQLKTNGADMSVVNKMKKAAAVGDISALLKAKSELDNNK